MFRRGFVVLILLCLLPFVSTFAQNDTPQQVLDAVNLLSQRLGTTLTINNMEQWSYDIQVFDSSSLGCAGRPGGTAGSYLAYIVSLRYGGTTYDIRVSSDRSIAFICGSNATPTPSFCDGGQTPRMIIGSVGRVTLGGLPNALRVQPNPTAGAVAEIPAGEQFLVLEGPRCGSGYTWWQVDYNGAIGWTPEGDATTYWIEPLDGVTTLPTATATRTSGGSIFSTNTPAPTITATVASATPSITPSITPTVLTATPAVTAIVPSTPIALNLIPFPTGAAANCPPITTHLAVGQPARVTLGGLPNNVRAQAGTSGAYLGEIPPGGVFNVVAGPSCASGYTWWQVDYNGLVGWTPEGDYPNFWLEPFPSPHEPFSGANINRVALRADTLNFDPHDLREIVFSADSSFMINGYPDMAALWDSTHPALGNVILMDMPAHFAFNPTDNSIVAVLDANGRAYTTDAQAMGSPPTVDLFTVPNFNPDGEFNGVFWSSAGGLLFAVQTGSTIEIWQGIAGQSEGLSISTDSPIVDAVVQGDPTGVFYATENGDVYFWSAVIATSQLIASYNAPIHQLAAWGETVAVVYQEGDHLAVDVVRSFRTGERLYYGRFEAGIDITNIAVTNDILAIAVNSANGNAVGLWDMLSPAQVWLPDQTQPVTEMRFSPDRTMLAIGSLDNIIRLWGVAAP